MAVYTQEQVFCENSEADDKTVKRHFLNRKETVYKCGICGISEWQDEPITLQLDHIDGVHRNNRLSNLRLLCPNCHSQTETYAGRNLWQKTSVTDDELISAIGANITISAALRDVNLDIGRTEYFARAKSLIDSGKAKLNESTIDDLFYW